MFRRSLIDPDTGSVTLRCFAIRRNDYFVAVCLDLCLATQAPTFEEARDKLHDQVIDHLIDAEAAGEMVSRPAPLNQWLTYYTIRAKHWASMTRDRVGELADMRVSKEELRHAS